MSEPILLPHALVPDLCGALAELGVQRLTLITPQGTRPLLARHTDLPGVILALGPSDRLHCDLPNALIEPAPGGRVTLRTDHAHLRARFDRPR